MKMTVCLNGTDTNPYHVMGLTQNPFPQIPKYGYDSECLAVASLGGDPIPHDRFEQVIREKLRGMSREFADLCVSQFVPGLYRVIEVEWPDAV